jgi:AcrR family transcriptional regulator
VASALGAAETIAPVNRTPPGLRNGIRRPEFVRDIVKQYRRAPVKRATRISRRGAMEPPIAFRPRRTPAQARSRATVAAILEAATRIFETRGYAATTTNLIAERAGVSVGSLYEYFPSKDAILVALTERHLEEVRRMLREATEPLAKTSSDLAAVVRAVVQATVKLHAMAPGLHRVLTEQSLRSPRARALATAAEQSAIRWWERYLRSQDHLSIRDPALTAAIVFGAIDSMTHKVVIHGDGTIPIDRYVDEVVALIVSYLLSSPRS